MAYYNYVLDMYMTWYKPYDEVNHPSVLLQTMASVPHSYYCGANIRVAPSFGIWYPNLTASVFYGHDNVDHLNIPEFGKNQPQFTFSMNNNLRLPHRWFMNLSGNVSTNAEMGIGRRKCTGNMQFRVSKNFLKNDALKVMFVVQDLLHTGYYYFEANGTQSHRTLTLMQGKPAGNHHGVERDGCGKSQNRKGQDHGALSHGLAPIPFPIPSPISA